MIPNTSLPKKIYLVLFIYFLFFDKYLKDNAMFPVRSEQKQSQDLIDKDEIKTNSKENAENEINIGFWQRLFLQYFKSITLKGKHTNDNK